MGCCPNTAQKHRAGGHMATQSGHDNAINGNVTNQPQTYGDTSKGNTHVHVGGDEQTEKKYH